MRGTELKNNKVKYYWSAKCLGKSKGGKNARSDFWILEMWCDAPFKIYHLI